MSAAQSFRHTESRCPQCNYKLDASTHIQGEQPGMPEDGDFSLCLNCGQVLRYGPNQLLRKANAVDIDELMRDSAEGWAQIEKAQMFIRKRGRFA